MPKNADNKAQELAVPYTPPAPVLPDNDRREVTPPRFYITQGTSRSLIQRGAKTGQFFLDLPDRLGGPVSAENLRLVLLDANLPMRVMFPYNPQTGEPVMTQAENKPWCGSSDGEMPRSTYWGSQYVDYRNGFLVTINEGFADPRTGQARATVGCAECPLGSWNMPVLNAQGERVIEVRNGKQVKVSKAPPCQESPAFVFYDLDRHTAIMTQASAFGTRAVLSGNRNLKEPGISYYYRPQARRLDDGSFVEISPTFDGQNMFPVLMSIVYKPNAYSGSYTPALAVGKTALTDEEREEITQISALYAAPDEKGYTVRDYLTGAAYGNQNDDDPFALPPNASSESDGGLTAGVDTEMAKRLLGQSGDRRVGGTDAF